MAQKENFQKQLDSILCTLKTKPKLLIHACCGPCSSYVLEYLCSFFDITVFYYNPNIYPEEEYFRRLNELKNFYKEFPPVLQNKITLVEKEYNPSEFYDAVKTDIDKELAKEREKGERCRRCYEFRLQKAYEYAKQNDFDYFCTTLSISPFKDAQKINDVARQIVEKNDGEKPKWLVSDFKKKGGFKRSLELSSQYGLYRQTYCGCIYSKTNDYSPLPQS